MAELALSMGGLENLTDLDLSHNKDLSGNAKTWASCLKTLTHLRSLEMQDCGTESRDVKYLAKAISEMGNLMDCNFSGSQVELDVSSSDSLIRLTIRSGSFRTGDIGEDMADILQSLCNRVDLVSLILENIYGLSDSVTLWTPVLSKLTHLEELELYGCSLQSTDIEHLAVALSQMPALRELSLKDNWSLGGSAESWAPSLEKLRYVRHLNLDNCALTEEDMRHIHEVRERCSPWKLSCGLYGLIERSMTHDWL
ncbi:leucine-rich repeat-containing protein 31-like [Acanthaster planci]|uniref:Leucine-rich repeat-containing protein 31-like n=1 Tax=Acanthaster planci TaxID=133434 RepID=A0A8B7ZYT9_ACAPL|nr:leucine-rich repeat-containing protein 31-like [Acanthaster planci]